MRHVDVLIVGAGPAGAATAVNLAPYRRVVLVERRSEITSRIGESLVPAARRLLADMGLLEHFIAETHMPWHGNQMVWGSPERREVDFLRNLDGHGWHLDRARFEQWLRAAAIARGAELLCPAMVDMLEHTGHQWHVRLKTTAGPQVITADVVIDAGGRVAPIARKLGARARIHDRLICAWLYGREDQRSNAGLTYVEAVEDGWWYSAPLPEGRRVLAFHTDADLPSAEAVRTPNNLLKRAAAIKELSVLFADGRFTPRAIASYIITNWGILHRSSIFRSYVR